MAVLPVCRHLATVRGRRDRCPGTGPRCQSARLFSAPRTSGTRPRSPGVVWTILLWCRAFDHRFPEFVRRNPFRHVYQLGRRIWLAQLPTNSPAEPSSAAGRHRHWTHLGHLALSPHFDVLRAVGERLCRTGDVPREYDLAGDHLWLAATKDREHLVSEHATCGDQ